MWYNKAILYNYKLLKYSVDGYLDKYYTELKSTN